MSYDKPYHDAALDGESRWGPDEFVVPAVVAQPAPEAVTAPPGRQRRVFWPAILFLATCGSTFFVGSLNSGAFSEGLKYSACLMTILVCHEMGHFLQTRRYSVPASLPWFLPLPLPPIGTLGAVIGMDARVGDRKALFDIGISGPLAGLVPTLIFLIMGLQDASVQRLNPLAQPDVMYGEPLLFRFLAWLKFGPIPEDHIVVIGPMAFAAWVGLLVTSLNLMPIGQLDGGHILYALLRRNAHFIASALLFAAIGAVIAFRLYGWSPILFLLFLMGPKHPPTANDYAPLGMWRILLGWLTLAFIFIGFTPMPLQV